MSNRRTYPLQFQELSRQLAREKIEHVHRVCSREQRCLSASHTSRKSKCSAVLKQRSRERERKEGLHFVSCKKRRPADRLRTTFFY
jgi:hypothetical protein